MARNLIAMLIVIAGYGVCFAQASGNVNYSQSGGKSRAEQNERNKRMLTKEEAPPTGDSMFIEASVLMNLKADEYVAIFGVLQECSAVPECNQKMDATTNQFAGELKQLGIGSEDIFVDFAAQNKIYSFQVADNIAKEKLVGFELKKNVSVHYKNKLLLDKLVIAASKAKHLRPDQGGLYRNGHWRRPARLMEEATKVIRQKAAEYEKLLGIKLLPPAQVYAAKPSIYYPTEMYDSYTAQESERHKRL